MSGQHFAFSPSPAANFVLFFTLVAIQGRGPHKVRVWASLGSLRARPGARSGGLLGFHTRARSMGRGAMGGAVHKKIKGTGAKKQTEKKGKQEKKKERRGGFEGV